MKFSILFLIVGLLAGFNSQGQSVNNAVWKDVKCKDGFLMKVRWNQKFGGKIDAATVDGIVLMVRDAASDSDVFFTNGTESAYVSVVVFTEREGRVVYQTRTHTKTHEDCELMPSIDDLKCKFMGICGPR